MTTSVASATVTQRSAGNGAVGEPIERKGRGRLMLVRPLADTSGPRSPFTPVQIAQALRGDRALAREIVDTLEPVIRARVTRVLYRKGRSTGLGHDIDQEVCDLTQDVFAALLADGGRILRSWDPIKGLSLQNFVGLCAEREATSILRSGRRSPWSAQPMDELMPDETHVETPGIDELVASRQVLERVLDELRVRLSPMGLHLFEQLFVAERPIEELVHEMNMTPDALYAWRSRLGKTVRAIFGEVTAARAIKGTSLREVKS